MHHVHRKEPSVFVGYTGRKPDERNTPWRGFVWREVHLPNDVSCKAVPSDLKNVHRKEPSVFVGYTGQKPDERNAPCFKFVSLLHDVFRKSGFHHLHNVNNGK